MMEILCSETNTMRQELPCGLKSEGGSDLAPARRFSRTGQPITFGIQTGSAIRTVDHPRQTDGKFEPCIVWASRDFGSVIRFSLFVPSIGPKEAKSVAKCVGELHVCTRIKWPCANVDRADQL
jgi:hypothetical protein